MQILVVSIARQIFNFQRSDFFEILHFTANLEDAKNQPPVSGHSPSVSSVVMVGLDRLELSTSPLSGVRSSHLSYRPELRSKRPRPVPQDARLNRGSNWWSWSGSNRRPPECKSGALPAELQPLDHRLRPSTQHMGISWPARRWPEFKSRPIGCKDNRHQADCHSNNFNEL